MYNNPLVNSLLTDLYQITMVYAYWKSKRHNQKCSFDLFFRKNPFKGEFTVFAGLSQVLGFMERFEVTQEQISYLKTVLPKADPEFFVWLKELNLDDVVLFAPLEGSVMFPRVPLIRVEGPMAVCQLIETTLLNLVNFASLICTNASRYRTVAGTDKQLLEFGLRRAQGPDGAMSASVYSYIGGFDGSSNVLAGMTCGIPISGTHAHAFITSFTGLDNIEQYKSTKLGNSDTPFYELCMKNRKKFGYQNTNDGELAAFMDYTYSFPDACLCLVDTYSTLESGIPNFLIVAYSLAECGIPAIGIRLDSGDLAYLSKCARSVFTKMDEDVGEVLAGFTFAQLKIVASNDINEKTLASLNLQGHAIDCYGIGTNLVTCQNQPALGCVYKLVEIEGNPRIKLSQEIVKVTIPGRKACFRLVGKDGIALLDYMMSSSETGPVAQERVLCRHPFVENKRAIVVPAKVIPLHVCVWKNGKPTEESGYNRSLEQIRAYVREQMSLIRSDVKRTVNPTPYKVSCSNNLFTALHDLWMKETPIAELS